MAQKTQRKPLEGDPDFAIYQLGIKEGMKEQQIRVLTYLQERYMDREIDRGSPKAVAILEIAGDLGKFLIHGSTT